MRLLIIATGLVLALPAAAGDVYRCTDSDGRVEYRDFPCAGRSGEKIELPANAVREIDQSAARAAGDAIGARARARVQADEAERRRAAAIAAENAPATVPQSEPVYDYGYYGDGYLPPPRAHRSKPRAPPGVIQRPPPSLPVDESKRRL